MARGEGINGGGGDFLNQPETNFRGAKEVLRGESRCNQKTSETATVCDVNTCAVSPQGSS